MQPQRRQEARSPRSLRPRAEWLEERCVFSVGVLDAQTGVFFALPSVVSFTDIVVNEPEAPIRAQSTRPLALEVPDATEPTATVDWGDGVVTGASVTTDEKGQTIILAERDLAAATTYHVQLTLTSGNDSTSPTVITFQITSPVPPPTLAPPPVPPVVAPTAPVTPPAPQANETPPVAPNPPPPPAPAPQQPVVVRVVLGPSLALWQSQFDAGTTRASLSAPVAPAVSVTVTTPGPPVLVSATHIARTAFPTPTSQPSGPESDFVLVSAPRSLEVVAATRVNIRTPSGRLESRSAPSAVVEEWHGAALVEGTVGSDDVLSELADEPVGEAPFFTALPQPEPREPASWWQPAYFVLATVMGVAARHYFMRDDNDSPILSADT